MLGLFAPTGIFTRQTYEELAVRRYRLLWSTPVSRATIGNVSERKAGGAAGFKLKSLRSGGEAVNNPIQPLKKAEDGALRFKHNQIVCTLLEFAEQRGMDLNDIACMDFNADDRQQFAQLIGYSLSGYGELSYVSDDAYGAAATMAEDGLSEKDARIAHLESELAAVRSALREPMARLYGVHPDDLNV